MTNYNQEFFSAVRELDRAENAGGVAAFYGAATAVRASEQAALPSHLVSLEEGQWAMWRCIGLRGAGFPARMVLRLAAPACAAAADRLLAAEDAARNACQESLKILNEALDALRSEGRWEDKARRNALLKVTRLLMLGKVPASSESLHPSEQASVEKARAARARINEARNEFQEAYEAGTMQISGALREVAGEGPFREAVIWQNRHAFHGSVDGMLRMTADSKAEGTKRRKHESMIVSYLQRYCVKNDTIGFFGPVGWATFNAERRGLQLNTGSGLLATRHVYFEEWCIGALVDMLNQNAGLRRWFAPRCLPYIYLDGDMLCMPMRRPLRLAAKHAAVLRQCAGTQTAREIAQALLHGDSSSRGCNFSSEQEVFAILEGLCTQRLILWQLELPLDAYPERRLRELLERIEDGQLREAALAPLDELERARDAVSAAAGDAGKLDAALGALEETFTTITGEASTRSAGRTYAGRTLVYEDCRRSTEVEIGSDIIGELAPALSILLKSARWFTYEGAKVLREELFTLYRELVKKNGGQRSVDGLTFWMQAQAQMFANVNEQQGFEAPVLDRVQEIFQQRWEKILGIEEGQRRVVWTSSEVRERAGTTFDAPHAGWTFGRYHSPDVMIAAESPAAIERGEYQLVMGELHLGNNTLGGSLFVEQHKRPQELIDAIESDLKQVRAVPMTPREWLTARVNHILISPRDYRLEFTVNAFHTDREKALPVGEMVVEENGDDLFARTRDGRLSFSMVEIFGGMFSGFVVNQFQLLKSKTHTPRVTIDRLIVARETWRFAPAAVSFADLKDDAERFIEARRWARSQGLPRFVFVKIPVETKPFYADFDSPVYVNLLAKMVRRQALEGVEGATLTMSEMIPGLEQVWLPDALGQSYTSELRMVALDLLEVPVPAQN
ncbi:MAG TPA: lantibiotic dehydratase [Pyrinomonadaceae bacterium]|jgi:hypothetical protein|nr:lantibiotic dehydratase [Pyrinomonadaceae bacterium]